MRAHSPTGPNADTAADTAADSATDTATYRPATADRIALLFLLGLVALGTVERTFAYVFSLGGILGPDPHLVQVRAYGLSATAAIASTDPGTAATPFAIDVTAGTVTVDQLTAVETGYLVAQHTIAYVAILAVVATLLLLVRNTFRGIIFGRANTILLTSGAAVGAAGYLLSTLFDQMASNELVNRLSGGHLELWMLANDNPTPALLATAALAVVLTAYAVGARMQRETAGLV